MEGRRHSVDIPISKALIALRRVKSLRDPSTSKFSPLVWETNPHREIAVCLENEQNGAKILVLDDNVEDLCCNNNSRKSHSKRVLDENNDNSGPNIQVNGSRIGQDMLMSERYYSSNKKRGLELACVTPSSDYLEGVDSCNEPKDGSMKDQTMFKPKKCYQTGTSGDVLSCVGDDSPCWPLDNDLVKGLSRTGSIYGHEDMDIPDSSQCGCGLSWSRTPKYRNGMEEQPLLRESSVEMIQYTKGRYKRDNYEHELYQESPRNLSQKFRPKCFNDLVGQNMVSISLLSTISSKKISSLYLFHGPHGTGKTSASRIFAAALHCVSLTKEKPCNQCYQCVQFHTGRCSDYKEIHALEINSTRKIRGLMKNPTRTSRLKVFVIEDCHLLREDTWACFLSCLEDIINSRIVFIMITNDIHKLPRLVLSRSQKYHFPKIKEAVISNRLEKMCVDEGFRFERDALIFIATKSGGSLRDAEMMLEQLSLVGKEITVSLAHDMMGVVSDGEILDLLHVAMSSDTAETVKRARELMSSRIDPLQLVTQLADLIMDILAGNGRLIHNYTSESELQQLSRALKILSDTEKQLRQSKNQKTWLTVALLQLSSLGPSLCSNESKLCNEHVQCRESEFCSTSSTNGSSKHLVPCLCGVDVSCKMTMSGCEPSLEPVWNRAASLCESRSLQKFLLKRGKLLSISNSQGLAVTVIGFHHPKHVAKAEKSWKSISSVLQHVLDQNIELRIHLLLEDSPTTDHNKLKKISINFFNCLNKISRKSTTITTTKDKYVETCSSDYGSQSSIKCCNVIRAIRNRDGNVLSMRRTVKDNECQDLCCPEPDKPDKRPGCLFRTLKLNKFRPSYGNMQNHLALSVVHTASSEAFF